MVYKRLCDGCGVELPVDEPYEQPRVPSGTFCYLGERYDLCKNCSKRVKRCIRELNETYSIIEKLKKSPNDVENQSDLSGFT